MFRYIVSVAPLLTVTGGIALYQVCLKSLPQQDYPFRLLSMVYTSSAILTLVLSQFFPSKEDAFNIIKQGRYGIVLLSAAPLIIECGYLWAFRSGWKLGMLNVGISSAGIILALCVGFVIFRERVSVGQFVGIGLCLVGFILAAKH